MDNTVNQIDYVAIYAAFISTIALLWNIINSIVDKVSKLNVDVSFYNSIFSVGNNIIGYGDAQKGPTSIKISIVNKGKRKKYIKSINIKLPYKTKYGDIFMLQKLDSKGVILIEPEDEYIFNFSINSTAELMFENYKEGKFKVIVVDTTNKKYSSKRMNTKVLKKFYDENMKLPKDVWALFENQSN